MRRSASKSVLALSERFLLALFLTGSAALFVHNDWLWRWDNLLYDSQLSFWKRAPSQDIVIIAIDDHSLSTLGRWPWPRSIHAKLVEKLKHENPGAIGLDIIFSEPDRYNPEHDEMLAQAIKTSKRVVLPVYMARKAAQSFPIEALPLPILTEHAAALGHVHIDLSDDGIARQVYLFEGIGTSRWPHFGLAILEVSGKQPAGGYIHASSSDNGGNIKSTSPVAERQWSRAQDILIPFAGPPGHFLTISYTQVLDGQYPNNFFDGKIVLIGATADGMGDILPTPFSGHSRAMSGIEINANIIDAMLQGVELRSIDKTGILLITVLLVLAPLFAFQYLKPRISLLVLLIIITGTVALSGIFLWLFHLWFSPAVAILFQVISYPLWSWRRLELAVRHLNHELDGLNRQRKKLSIQRRTSISRSIQFIRFLLPVNGWVLLNENGIAIRGDGKTPAKDKGIKDRSGWDINPYSAWATIRVNHTQCRLGLSFKPDSLISSQEKLLLDQLLLNLQESEHEDSVPSDFLDAKIQQIQLAENNLLKLRRFIDDGLSNMSDGIIVCDACGEILMSNARASWYLMGDDNIKLNNLSLQSLLKDINLSGNANWKPLLHKALIFHKRVITQAQHKSGRDLMVQISPLNLHDSMSGGLVINLSDIQLLKASEKKRDELLNFLSHDLRSPLASTLALIELAKTRQTPEELSDTMEKITSQTQKTLHLAEQFLQLSRAKSNLDLPLYDIDFNTVILNAIELVWQLAQKRHIRITHTFESEELWMLGEPDLLERAMVNLLSNAIKYSDEDTTIHVNVSTSHHMIRCCISDEGYGISESDLPNLFELFKRVHRDGKKHKLGIGLGLAFVDAVAKRHHGHVDVESTAGVGSSFCFTIPDQHEDIT